MGGENYTSVPTILSKGKWLEEAGFHIGEYVSIEINGDEMRYCWQRPPHRRPKQERNPSKRRSTG